MRLPLPSIVVAVLVLAGSATWAAEPQWTRFRGPNGTGVGEASAVPVSWTDRDYLWKTKLPGTGFSSPVVWDDRLYVTSALEEQSQLIVFCVRTNDGRVQWQQQFAVKPHPKVKSNIDASATPAVDKDRVYVVWGTPDEHVAVALDRRTGRPLWRTDLAPFVAEDGFANSPVLAADVVVVANDQDAEGTSSLVALD